MNHARRLQAAALLAGMALACWAQTPEPVLKGKDVTESALVDALSVEGPSAPEGATLRGFKPMQRPTTGAPKAGPGRASLLITFAFDSSELTDEAKSVLDTLARAMQSDNLAGLTFKVEGHADPRGVAEHNQKLSQTRAEAVVEYLVSKHGILVERLQPLGKGSSEPYDPARPDAPENRRVTIVTNRN
jgi:outer membrane protein OmpA-like peptidoglycan-associated protein